MPDEIVQKTVWALLLMSLISPVSDAGYIRYNVTVHAPEGDNALYRVSFPNTFPQHCISGQTVTSSANEYSRAAWDNYPQIVFISPPLISLASSPYTGYANAIPGFENFFLMGAHALYYIDLDAYVNGAAPPSYPEEPSKDAEDGSTDEPIDTRNGNNYFTEKRISVPCPGVSLEVDLKYQSLTDLPNGTLGEGWRHSLEWSLDVQTNQALLYTGTGKKRVFREDGSGGYHPPEGRNWTLEETAAGYEVGLPGGLAYSFDANGRLSTIHDAWGQRVECSYGSNSCLESATHSNGRQIVFSNKWHAASGQWRTASISVQDGMALAFDYNGDGQLAKVVEQIDGGSFTSSYYYANGVLTNKVNGAGFEYSFGYETGADSLLNGKGIHLDVGGYYQHEVEYVNPDTTYVRYSLRGTEQVYRYFRNGDGMLATRHGPGESVSDAMMRGVNYSYAANNEDRTGRTLFDTAIGETRSEWMYYDDAHNVTNFAVSYCTTNPVPLLSMEFDPVWQLPSAVVDAKGHRVEILYTNGSPQVVKAFHSDSNSYDTCFSFASNGLVNSITNANGHVMLLGYDAGGNLVRAARELGPVVTNTFDSLGFVQSMDTLSENGAATGRITQFDTDARGRIRKVTHPDGREEFFAYNALGYLTNSVDRAGRVTDYSYAPSETLTSVTRWLNEGGSNVPVRIGYSLDQQLNLLRISEPRGRYVESYQLDIQDRAVVITNIENQVMEIEYGVGDVVRKTVRFDGTAVTNTYDSAGRKTRMTYLSDSQSPLAVIDSSYFPDGKVNTIADNTSSITNAYDRLNRLTNVICSVSSLFSVVNHQYDPVGNVTNTVVNIGGATSVSSSYEYDAAERLTKISRKGTAAQSFVYAYSPANGLVASVSNTASGITCVYAYDLMDRATNLTFRAGEGTILRSLNYEYNAAGMINRKTIAGETTSVSSYAYDSLDRLIRESRSGAAYSTVYKYDLASNRLSKTADGMRTGYTLGIGNRLDSTTNQPLFGSLFVTGTANEPIGTDNRWGELWITNLTTGDSAVPSINGNSFLAEIQVVPNQTNTIHAAVRDRAGNMGYAMKDFWLGIPAGGTTSSAYYYFNSAGCLTNLNGVSLKWDERYRLETVQSAQSANVSYTYDVLNRRISRTEISNFQPQTTNCTLFVYDGDQVVADFDGSGSLLRTYTWGAGIDNLLCFTDHSTGNTYFAIKDHQNSVVALVDDSGTVVESYEYDAWGNTKVLDGSGVELTGSALGNRYGFQGREIDWSTGLYYFRARWYDSPTGRWLSKDPIGIEGGLNQYVAFASNPVLYVDPDGKANFMSRPLSGSPSNWKGWASDNPIFDRLNIEMSHEQIFFTDEKGGNIGFFNDNQVRPDSVDYLNYYRNTDSRDYDDALMRRAVELAKPKPYQLTWFGPGDKFNCQDWGQLVRDIYDVLEKTQTEDQKKE